MIIRRVSEADAGEIADIYNVYVKESTASFEIEELTDEDMRCRIADIATHCPYWVCEEDGKIIGYCYVHPWKERAAYAKTLETTVYVAADCKGKGVGRMLMQRVIDDCRALGYVALVACITGGNEASVRLHERLGFRQVSHFRKVGFKLGLWLDVVDYELLLQEMP